MLKGTKSAAFDCVTKPKPVSAKGFPTLGEISWLDPDLDLVYTGNRLTQLPTEFA